MSDALLGRELSPAAKIVVAVALVVSFAYSVVVAGQILLWVYIVVLAVLAAHGIRLVGVFLRLADAVERIADELERTNAERVERLTDESGE